jgi:hypothetical protein
MKQGSRKMRNKFFALITATAVIASYQACGPIKFLNSSGASQTKMAEGNGDSYSGKLGYYNSSENNNPCQRLSTKGQPFPQQQIFFMNGAYTLVRDQCKDITPIALDSASVQVDPIGQTLTYQGKSFAYKSDLSEFNQVPVVCPVGKTLDVITGNIFASPLDLTASAWQVHPEIPAVLGGSIEALPNFLVQVSDPNKLEDWRRVSQNPYMTPNTSYVVSFLLKAGNQNFASITYNELPAGQFVVAVDLINAQATVQWQQGSVTPLITSVQRYGAGVAVSVAFTSSPTLSGPGGDLGVAPYRPNNNNFYALGDSIFATSPGLYYCR